MKNYFQLSRNDKIGVVSVAVLIVVGVVVLNINQNRGLGEPTNIEVDSLSLASNDEPDSEINDQKQHKSSEKADNEIIPFYPNKIGKSEWENLGFSEKQTQSIINYRKNYGPFRSTTDVCEIYVVSEEKCQELSPYMRFDSDNTSPQTTQMIDINRATTKDLEFINGIGPTFSERIIKYRNSLGGFTTKSQYKEVYGLSDFATENLMNQTNIDQSKIDKIKINSASKDKIKQHPYLRDWPVVSEILHYRDKQEIKNLDFLISKELITLQEKEKITPYIDFNN